MSAMVIWNGVLGRGLVLRMFGGSQPDELLPTCSKAVKLNISGQEDTYTALSSHNYFDTHDV